MIKTFLCTYPRNKLILCNTNIPNLDFLDIGLELSMQIKNASKIRPQAIYEMLICIIEQNLKISALYGTYIAIKNIGIIFEPQLGLNFRSIIDKLSKDYVLIIYTDGVFDNNEMYFLTKQRGLKVDLKGFTCLNLINVIEHEI